MTKAKKKQKSPAIQPLDRKKGLYLQESPGKGRGVFCRTDIAKGEVLEVTPALILDGRATDHADKTILANYTFRIGRTKGVKSPAAACSVVMGILSYCNHDERPNARIEWEEIDGSVYYLLRATRRIPKNTEICTSYGTGWFSDRE
jgi:SET domain-containing protein